MTRSVQFAAAAVCMGCVLTGCSSQETAPPAKPTAAQSSSATSNSAVKQVLQDPKTSPAAADYIKSHLPPSSSPNGR